MVAMQRIVRTTQISGENMLPSSSTAGSCNAVPPLVPIRNAQMANNLLPEGKNTNRLELHCISGIWE